MKKIFLALVIVAAIMTFTSCDETDYRPVTRSHLISQGFNIITLEACRLDVDYIFSATLEKDNIVYIISNNKMVGMYHVGEPDSLEVKDVEFTGDKMKRLKTLTLGE